MPTERGKDARGYEKTIQEALGCSDVPAQEIQRLIVSSVAPDAAGLSQAFDRLFEGKVVWADHRMDFGFRIEYDDPSQVGTDRLASALAASEIYGVPVIVADVGTAITVDMVTADRRFVGGAIAPGRQMAADALHRGTSLLPRVEPGEQPPLTGRSTSDCIRSGLLHGAVGLVDTMIERLRARLDPAAFAVATGGDAAATVEASKYLQTVNPHLVLRGLYLLYRRSTAEAGDRQVPERWKWRAEPADRGSP
jgi:type III pantothenate kinase